MPAAALLAQPLATAEFVALDTETNGLGRERCELTEVGAVLVGGGELHDRWSSLVGVGEPLGRGIQRFTGITQAMVDEAPPPEAVLPELATLLRGRVLVAHNAAFDTRVLKQAFARAALDWPDPPVLCTVALARRFAPLQRRRGLASLADALGIDVGEIHRALPDAETCARVLCALLPRLGAAAFTIGDALAAVRPKQGAGRRRRAPGAKRSRDERPDLSKLPDDPGVYIFRDADGHPLYVGKSVCLRTRARAHFTTPVAWTGRAEHVDYQPTESELGALLLENRLIKRLLPPGNVNLKKGADGYVYLRCRLDIPFPILEVAHEPAAGHAVCIGPVRGRAAAAELIEQINSLFGLRHCGRAMPRRPWPSAYGQMGRCLSPCLGDLDPNLYRARVDAALALFAGRDGRAALLAHVEAQMGEAAGQRAYERAEALRRRREARAPTRCGSWAAGWPTGDRSATPTTSSGAPRRRCGRRRGRRPGRATPTSRPTRSTKCESSAAGWPPTRTSPCWLCARRPRGRAWSASPGRGGPPRTSGGERRLDHGGGDPAGVKHVARLGLAAHERQRDRPEGGRHHAGG